MAYNDEEDKRYSGYEKILSLIQFNLLRGASKDYLAFLSSTHPKICSKGYKCAYEGDQCSCYGNVAYGNDKTLMKEVDGQIKCSEDEIRNISRIIFKQATDTLEECWCYPNSKRRIIF